MEHNKTVHYEASRTFKADPTMDQDSEPWRKSLELFHATTLPGLVHDALRTTAPVTWVALSVVAGKQNANVDVGRRVVAQLAGRHSLPTIDIDHHEAHLVAALLCTPAPAFPYLGLTAAGGHYHLKLARALGDYTTLGSHEAAPRNRLGHGRAPGSVLDRCSELVGTVPPGQPDGAIAIDDLSRTSDDWSYRRFPVTEGLNRDNGYSVDLHALYGEVARALTADGASLDRQTLAVSVQECVMTVLLDKAFAAARDHATPRIAFGGGVAANSRLRALALERAAAADIAVYFPPKNLCVDNARMIAFTALERLRVGLDGDLCGFS